MATKREVAAGALGLVQAFVNTADLEAAEEHLATPAALHAFLTGHGLLDAATGVSDADVAALQALREAFRDLLLANNGAPLSPTAVATLDRFALAAPLRVRFAVDGRAALEPATSGIAAAIARLLAGAQQAIADGSWYRLKICRDDVCRWAFYDASKNHSGAWCSMPICGNRAKVRAYKQRHRNAD